MAHKTEQTSNHNPYDEQIPSSKWGEDIQINSELVERNLEKIKKNIAPCKPRIIGVTKYYGLSSIINGYKAGLRDFGESRAGDAINKIKPLPDEIRENSKFHFIGHLQTNKAEKVVEYFDYIHSVDSLKLAKVISEKALELNKQQKILLQVNNAGEIQKFGYDKSHLVDEFDELKMLEGLDIVGLMNMAPLGAEPDELCRLFCDLREFRNFLENKFSVKLPELSMGMSDDYLYAVKEGATMIRIGRKLFK